MLTYQAPNTPSRHVVTVTQLNRQARQLLETHMNLLWVEGELSNFARPSSGHWYFTLKDSGAQVRCAMFRNRNQQLKAPPRQGQQVLVRARVSLYEGRGDYQLIVEHMEDAGHGALQQAYEQLKQQLHNEGLFDPSLKQPLPSIPKHLGVITSPGGAAIRDVLHVLERRFPSLPVTIFPVAVQGEQAGAEIVTALERANRLSADGLLDCDLLLVTRGGGSLEDLWAFNEEQVARAIYASRLPVISAVGHEIDTTISDYVADVRAPTPSAAAEICTPDSQDMELQFAGYESLLTDTLSLKLERFRHRLTASRARLQHPGQRLQAQAQRLDNLELRLTEQVRKPILAAQHRQQKLQLRLNNLNPRRPIEQRQQQLNQLQQRLEKAAVLKIEKQRQRLSHAAGLLDGVSPLNTLKRGYSITSDEKGSVITQIAQLKPKQSIQIRVSDGTVDATVKSLKNR
jgi:exodeoxyribonuclease VII large subunit